MKIEKRQVQLGFLLAISLLILFFGLPLHSHASPGSIKNVIIMIGDGMGAQQLGLLNAYAKYAPNSIYKSSGRKTAIEEAMEAGTLGLAYHEAANVLVTDSAASSTQMASGEWAGSEMIGIDQHGKKTETILEKAEKMGKATGLVSDTRLTHATPAGFAAHQPHRSRENDIAVDMLNNDVDVMLSGGLRHWIPKAANDKDSKIHNHLKARTGGEFRIKSKRKDARNLLNEAEDKGYALAFTKMQLQEAKGDKVLGLFSYSGMPDGIQHKKKKDSRERTVPTLKEMAAKAIDILSKNEKGFFLMVEAGQIDWAGHANDAGTMLHEMVKFDETVDYVFDWVKKRKDTLLIITADHETGGFGFSYSRFNLPEPKKFPGDQYPDTKFAPNFNFGNHEILDKLYGQKLSYQGITSKFDRLPKNEQTPAALAKIVNENTGFPITGEEAAAVLEVERNEYYLEGHKVLSKAIFPKINDFKEFYVYGMALRNDILGRIVAKYQNVVWSTGTHTNAPVPLIIIGPKETTLKFSRLMHTTEWGQTAIEVLEKGR
ncbi:MAG: alkaline phosphatase [Deltaproteobacteria bacterium]|nr:alkaline phosphatase [Deltaproteobacteria bacterium]